MNPIDSIIYLCKCAVNQEIPDVAVVSRLDLPSVYQTARKHMLAAICGAALLSAGIHDEQFDLAYAMCCRKTMILEAEKDELFQQLDKAEIWHMPLKGTVLRDWYPSFGMRESADCDILFDKTREEEVKEIMLGLGYDLISYGKGHHDVYMKPPVTNMQMHVALFGTGFEKRLNDYYEGVRDRLVHKSGNELCFTLEDFYIYFLAHNHRDYSNSGTGLRSVLDTYVFLTKYQDCLDWDYIRSETAKLEIQDYERKNRLLALHLFGDEPLTEEDRDMLRYLVSSGVYGTMSNAVNNKVQKFGGGWIGMLRYILQRLILPMDVIEHSFPFFYKYKILLPLLPLYRLIKGLKDNRKKLRAEFGSFRRNIK